MVSNTLLRTRLGQPICRVKIKLFENESLLGPLASVPCESAPIVNNSLILLFHDIYLNRLFTMLGRGDLHS